MRAHPLRNQENPPRISSLSASQVYLVKVTRKRKTAKRTENTRQKRKEAAAAAAEAKTEAEAYDAADIEADASCLRRLHPHPGHGQRVGAVWAEGHNHVWTNAIRFDAALATESESVSICVADSG